LEDIRVAKTTKNTSKKVVDIATILRGEYTLMALRLRGDLLLVHQWTQKATFEMLATMAGHPVAQLNKDLTKEGEDSAYRNEKGEDVLPCRTIKACFVGGASQTRGAVKAHEFKRHVRVIGHTAPLHWGSIDRCNVEPVKVGLWNDRRVDLRARTMYSNWYCDIIVRFPHVIIGADKVVAAIRASGDCVGLCEKRIEKGFELGGFSVESVATSRIESILDANSSPEKRFEIPEILLRSASTKLEGVNKRNYKKKAVSVAMSVNGAVDRHAADEAVS
jgi:hypothetical protein